MLFLPELTCKWVTAFLVPKATQILTEGFMESKWWKLIIRITTTTESTICMCYTHCSMHLPSEIRAWFQLFMITWWHTYTTTGAFGNNVNIKCNKIFFHDSQKTKFFGKEIDIAFACCHHHVKTSPVSWNLNLTSYFHPYTFASLFFHDSFDAVIEVPVPDYIHPCTCL